MTSNKRTFGAVLVILKFREIYNDIYDEYVSDFVHIIQLIVKFRYSYY
jgi:hypothetical protein